MAFGQIRRCLRGSGVCAGRCWVGRRFRNRNQGAGSSTGRRCRAAGDTSTTSRRKTSGKQYGDANDRIHSAVNRRRQPPQGVMSHLEDPEIVSVSSLRKRYYGGGLIGIRTFRITAVHGRSHIIVSLTRQGCAVGVIGIGHHGRIELGIRSTGGARPINVVRHIRRAAGSPTNATV